MGTFENRIEQKTDQLGWSTSLLAAVAGKFNIPGASEPNLSKAFRRLKDLSTESALELDLLLSRIVKMCGAFEPFSLKLDDPARVKELLKDFEEGSLVVSVTRHEPGALVYSVYAIENVARRNTLFQGIQDGEPRWGSSATPIREKIVADAAVELLSDMGHPCHSISIQMRTTESKITKTLSDLGLGGSDAD